MDIHWLQGVSWPCIVSLLGVLLRQVHDWMVPAQTAKDGRLDEPSVY
jgi:hypothetical protein